MTKNIKHICTYSVIVFLLIIISIKTNAQGPNGVVDIIKTYNPAVPDAYKIDINPIMDDTTKPRIKMTYSLQPQRIASSFEVRPIKAADIKNTFPKLPKGSVAVGLGWSFLPYVDASVNSQRSDSSRFGASFKHITSPGQIKLDNDVKVSNGRGNTELHAFGERIFRKDILHAEINAGTMRFHNYGYDTSYHTTIDKKRLLQQFIYAGANIGIQSIINDTNSIPYYAKLEYNYFGDKHKARENVFTIKGGIQKYYFKQTFGLDGLCDILATSKNIDSNINAIVNVHPYVSNSNKIFSYNIGMNIVIDKSAKTKAYIYPNIFASYNGISNVLTPYAGIGGEHKVNNYRTIAEENNYITSGLDVRNTRIKTELYAGISGKLSRKVQFNMRAGYSFFTDDYYYAIDTLDSLRNTFRVVYDTGSVLKLTAELKYDYSEKLKLGLKGNYYTYSLKTFDKPWHKPVFDIAFTTTYNMQNKIFLKVDFVGTGLRYVQKAYNSNESTKLRGLASLNLGIDYAYKTSIIFLRAYNLLATRNYLWQQYPEHRIYVLAGFRYNF